MKTIAMLSQKGGATRSTTSIHLAVEAERRGKTVALLDIDPQASAAGWADNRNPSATLAVSSIQPTRLRQALKAVEASGAELVICDTAPHTADAAIMAAECCDLILIPCRPGILDLRAISPTVKIAKLVGKPAYVFLSAVPHRAPRIVADAVEVVEHHGVPVAPVIIHHRSVFGRALIHGLVAQEFEPNGNAAQEIAQLYDWAAIQLYGNAGMQHPRNTYDKRGVQQHV